jgi:hypothetical protein
MDHGSLPPTEGAEYTVLVGRVDADGNMVDGVRHPDLAVPIGTFTGWNLRRDGFGEGGQCAGHGLVHPVREDARRAARIGRSAPLARGALPHARGVRERGAAGRRSARARAAAAPDDAGRARAARGGQRHPAVEGGRRGGVRRRGEAARGLALPRHREADLLGFAHEATPAGDVEPHPGRARRYYALTREGRSALAEEAARLKGAVALAERRLRMAGGRR